MTLCKERYKLMPKKTNLKAEFLLLGDVLKVKFSLLWAVHRPTTAVCVLNTCRTNQKRFIILKFVDWWRPPRKFYILYIMSINWAANSWLFACVLNRSRPGCCRWVSLDQRGMCWAGQKRSNIHTSYTILNISYYASFACASILKWTVLKKYSNKLAML